MYLKQHLRMLWLTVLNTLLGRTKLYWGLIQMKWIVRAILGLRPIKLTTNIFGKSTGRIEGLEPWEKGSPRSDEPHSIWFTLFSSPKRYEHRIDNLGEAITKKTYVNVGTERAKQAPLKNRFYKG